MTEDSYDAIRERFAALLRRDAALHRQGQFQKLGADFMALQSQLRHGGDERYRKLLVALSFWDAWILGRNTDWLENCHVEVDAWPRLADVVAADLEADCDITDSDVIKAFDLSSTLELPKQLGPKREPSPIDKLLSGDDS
ncbi:MAG: hypothetical protein ACT4NU_11420 [Chromatiales bacterium]